jgi:Skp family chaperone for outer membrane proteins
MRLLSIVSAAAIAVAAIAATSDASAQRNRNNGQATTSVVINYQRVLAESAIGRDLQSKLQTIRGRSARKCRVSRLSSRASSKKLNASRRLDAQPIG